MKAILVDDEPLALDFLERKITQLSDIEVVGKFIFLDFENQAELIKEVDIIFLDIEMPEVSGLELADMLLQENPDVSIIFVTAFKEYAIQAFELNALDYILKPIESDRLERALQRAVENIHNEKKQKSSTGTYLAIELCQDLSFSTEKEENIFVQWRTTKAKELFLYLLHNKGQPNQKSNLIEIFWGDLEEDKAYAQLYTTIYHTRRAISQFSNHFSLQNLHESYILHLKDVFIDVVKWERQLQSLPRTDDSTINQWEKVMKTYTTPYLEGYDTLWIQAERFRLERIWLKSAFQIATYYKASNNIEKAENWYLKICKFIPEEEEAHFQLMKIYEPLKLGLLINHQYESLNKTMQELGLEISPHIQKWYKDWLERIR